MSTQPLAREAGARVAELFDDHARLVLGICRMMLPYADAEDAAQQTFVSAHRALLGGVEPRDEAAWLATIARNECRLRLRHGAAAPMPTDNVDRAAPDARDPAALAVFHAQLGELRSAIGELPERQREALLLRDFYGLAYEDVAAAMSVSVASVESLLVRARRTLKASLGEVPRLVGALTLPSSLREGLSLELPGFSAEDVAAGAAATGGAVGLAAKLMSMPFGTKIATASVATLALGAGIGQQAMLDRHRTVPPRAEAASERSRERPHVRRPATRAEDGAARTPDAGPATGRGRGDRVERHAADPPTTARSRRATPPDRPREVPPPAPVAPPPPPPPAASSSGPDPAPAAPATSSSGPSPPPPAAGGAGGPGSGSSDDRSSGTGSTDSGSSGSSGQGSSGSGSSGSSGPESVSLASTSGPSETSGPSDDVPGATEPEDD